MLCTLTKTKTLPSPAERSEENSGEGLGVRALLQKVVAMRVESKIRACRLAFVALVIAFPGRTACELWDEASEADRATLKELQECRRRLTDLQSAGLVRGPMQRKCRVRGTLQTTWHTVGRIES